MVTLVPLKRGNRLFSVFDFAGESVCLGHLDPDNRLCPRASADCGAIHRNQKRVPFMRPHHRKGLSLAVKELHRYNPRPVSYRDCHLVWRFALHGDLTLGLRFCRPFWPEAEDNLWRARQSEVQRVTQIQKQVDRDGCRATELHG